MTTVCFPESDTVVTFDGVVLEVFGGEYGSRRYHIHQLKSIQVVTDRKGKHQLDIVNTPMDHHTTLDLDEPLGVKVNLLLTQVQLAMASFKFD